MIETNDKYRVYWIEKSTGSHGREYTNTKREDFAARVLAVKKIKALLTDSDVVAGSIKWIGLSQEYIVEWSKADCAYIRIRVNVEDSMHRKQVKSITDIHRLLNH